MHEQLSQIFEDVHVIHGVKNTELAYLDFGQQSLHRFIIVIRPAQETLE